MKEYIYDIIEDGNKQEKLNRIYSVFMLICIVISIIPLCFRKDCIEFEIIDKVTVTIFIIDYILRLFTADIKYGDGAISYIKYPFSFMAIIDLLSILPSITLINNAFKTLRIIRLSKLIRVFRTVKTVRVVKTVRYSSSANLLIKAIKKSKESLFIICWIALIYVFSVALIMFNVEPQTFKTMFDAIYWAMVSLTTVGYGDIYAVSTIGKLIAMVSSFIGIAIIALPSGIITSALVEELNNKENKE